MSKKIVVLALAVSSAAFFALPTMAFAQEIHLEPSQAFNTSGPGGELRAEAEVPITCTKTAGSGSYNAGSTTTGSSTLDFTGCHTEVFGFTASCKSEGAATAGTIASGGTFHLITISSGFPGVLLTTNTTKITCASIATITTSGNVIGTISRPGCGGSSNVVELLFEASGAITTQKHLTYTGAKFDLVSKTGNGEPQTSALVGTATNTTTNASTLNCT